MKVRKHFILAALLLICAVSILLAVDYRSFKQSLLKGLKGVNVTAEDINPKMKTIGLTKEILQTDVELQLRRSGIRVLSEKEWFETENAPQLYINITGGIWEDALVYYNVAVEYKENVSLVRKQKTQCFATIWEEGGTSSVGVNDALKSIREGVQQVVDTFCNDYLAANPTQPSTNNQGEK